MYFYPTNDQYSPMYIHMILPDNLPGLVQLEILIPEIGSEFMGKVGINIPLICMPIKTA